MEFVKCSVCGKDVPSIAQFCTFCGAKMEAAPAPVQPAAPAAPAAPELTPVAAPVAAAMAEPAKGKRAKKEKAPKADKPAKSGKKNPLLTILAVVAILGLGGWLVMQFIGQKNDAESYKARIDALESEIAAEQSNLDSIAETLDAMAYDADAAANELAMIENWLRYSGNGIAPFHVSSPIVVMSLTDGDIGRVTLTTDYDDYCYVWYEQDTYCCSMEYAADSWEGSTVELLFYPNEVGTTTFTFTNDLGSDSFQVLAVVLP
ncbi:MAG: hypothetical protein IJC61_01430 [Oscillospiraceae bacterium]|nr:hypothetical protein [Oscillospiraceae bacterium]